MRRKFIDLQYIARHCCNYLIASAVIHISPTLLARPCH